MAADKRPMVAIVGRPNVGKSTLVNRLAQRRSSIVGPISGLTRDRLDVEVSWRGRTFILNDTGGLLEPEMTSDAPATLSAKVVARAMEAIGSADVVVFVVDSTTGVTSDDLALAKRLRRLSSPLIVAGNKADDTPSEVGSAELWGLGLGEPLMVSAVHGRGSGDLLDRIVDLLPEASSEDEVQEVPSIALVGRPNVGKSSLFNRFVGQDRAIVHHEPGTTRDSIDTIIEIEGKSYRFIDTAGIRRRAKTQGVEIYSASRTREAIERADLAILVVDAEEGATSQDQRIAEQVADSGVGAIVALNKWDLIDDPDVAKIIERSMSDRLHFVDYAPMVRTSAQTKRGLEKLTAKLDGVLESRAMRVSTGRLNALIQRAQEKTPPPRAANKNVKVLYATQASVAPPTFVLFATGKLQVSWLRYIERRLREEFGFEGNPIRLISRERTRVDRRAG